MRMGLGEGGHLGWALLLQDARPLGALGPLPSLGLAAQGQKNSEEFVPPAPAARSLALSSE